MDIVDLIRRDHDEVAELFDQLGLAVRARDGRYSAVAARLVAVSRIHMRAEEQVVYEALLPAVGPLKAFALAGPHEHENLDITFDKLLVRRSADEYEVIVKVARDLFEMHARDEEEADILPLICEALTADERVALARDMVTEQLRIRPQILRLVGMPARAA